MQKLAGLKEELRNSLMETESLRSFQINHRTSNEEEEREEDSQSEASETSQSATCCDEESQSGRSESGQSQSEDSEEDEENVMTSYDDIEGEEDFVNIEDYDVIKQDRNQLLAVNKVQK